MKAERVNVDPENPGAMFEDSNLVGKVIAVKYGTSYPQEYLVIGNSNKGNKIGLKMAGVIRRSPISSDCIEVLTAESLSDKSLHFAFAESISSDNPVYNKYDTMLRETMGK